MLLPSFLSSSSITLLSSHAPPVAVNEALSGIFGSISISCWVFLLLPQLLENYRNQSAEAISLPFILIWFLGDVFNIVGAFWASLVPIIIAIGLWFCVVDGCLIGQVLYYGIKNRRMEGRSLLEAARGVVTEDGARQADGENGEEQEEQPLLKRTRSISVTIPGSQSHGARRRSTLTRTRTGSSTASEDPLAKIVENEQPQSKARTWLKNTISIAAVWAVGTAGWLLAYESGAWVPQTDSPAHDDGSASIAKGAQMLGYASAVLYLCARIPQIVKNWREKSCEGLSLLFFILSIMGNLTYGAGILCHSLERKYVIKNIPWLIGSLGTMVEDIIIFVQFHIYRDAAEEESAIE